MVQALPMAAPAAHAVWVFNPSPTASASATGDHPSARAPSRGAATPSPHTPCRYSLAATFTIPIPIARDASDGSHPPALTTPAHSGGDGFVSGVLAEWQSPARGGGEGV